MDMQLFGAYIPLDRRHALANGYELANRTKGAALFADISGFTPLTEALANELGARRGAEELTQTLNMVYTALVQSVHMYHGSVIGFAGDAITCWFENDDGLRAVSSALAMQSAMNDFRHIQTPGGQAVELAIKTAVAIGSVRRFLVGDAQIQVMDVLAGDTLSQMAAAEHMAERNEVVITAVVVEKLHQHLTLGATRHDEEGHTYHVVTDLDAPMTLPPWPRLPADALSIDQMRPWLLPPVYNQLSTGQETFLAELRPAVTIFLFFDGIDYDGDDAAGEKLDQYVSWVQNVLGKYEGYLLQLIMGDKGSYLYAAFGAPLAHGDDGARAVAAAWELREATNLFDFIVQTKIGVSVGRLRAGAYGSATRQTYGVLGDAVNTAARLMQAAAPGQVLVSPTIVENTRKQFMYQGIGDLTLKGKAEPLAVSELLGLNNAGVHPTTLSLHPLLGREAEMGQMLSGLNEVAQEHGRVMRISGAAGMGKSHLALAVVGQARQQGWQTWLSACQSTTQTTPYFVWRQVFRALFALDESLEGNVAQQIEKVSTAVGQANPEWNLRLPLLGDLLGLPIPDNQATAAFDPRLRQESLITLAIDILHHHAAQAPLLLFVDDAQWMDEASQTFTLNLARTLENHPIYLLLMHRPPLDNEREILPEINKLPLHHTLELSELTPEAVTMLAAYRLGGPIAPLLNEVIQSLAQGNPFFTEELLTSLQEGAQLQQVQRERGAQWELADHVFNALREANCLVKKEGEWRIAEEISLSAAALGLPDSIYGLVLSRLDRLEEEQKLTLKVASVIGRLFEFDLLNFAHPVHPAAPTLLAEITGIENRDFIRLEQPDPRLTYTFKHNTTQEVVYETLLFAQRRELHRTIATWYETTFAQDAETLANFYPLLAYHWRYAEEKEKERQYALLAGEQAAAQYANEDALRYFSRALALTPVEDVATRYRLLLGREAVYGLTAQREPQAADLTALETLVSDALPQYLLDVMLRRIKYYEMVSDMTAMQEAAQELIRLAPDNSTYMIQAQLELGVSLWRQGQLKEARTTLEDALLAAVQNENTAELEARILHNLGAISFYQHNIDDARQFYEEALQKYRELGNRKGEANALDNIAGVAFQAGDYASAQQTNLAAFTIHQEIGSRRDETRCLSNLGTIYHAIGELEAAVQSQKHAIRLAQEVADPSLESLATNNYGLVLTELNNHELALSACKQAVQLDHKLGDSIGEGYSQTSLALAYETGQMWKLALEAHQQALMLRQEQANDPSQLDNWAGLIRGELAQQNLTSAGKISERIVRFLEQTPEAIKGVEHPVRLFLTLIDLYRQLGNTTQAIDWRRKGQNFLLTRAAKISDATVREKYLQTKWNQRLLLEES